jgi:hypothetical protein
MAFRPGPWVITLSDEYGEAATQISFRIHGESLYRG